MTFERCTFVVATVLVCAFLGSFIAGAIYEYREKAEGIDEIMAERGISEEAAANLWGRAYKVDFGHWHYARAQRGGVFAGMTFGFIGSMLVLRFIWQDDKKLDRLVRRSVSGRRFGATLPSFDGIGDRLERESESLGNSRHAEAKAAEGEGRDGQGNHADKAP